MVTHARVFSLLPKTDLSEFQRIFISCSLRFLRYRFGMDNMCTWDKIKKLHVSLPVSLSGELDYCFMDSFIGEMKAVRTEELTSYLSTKGLSGNECSEKDERVINNYSSIQWKEFRMGDLFNNIKKTNLHQIHQTENQRFIGLQ